MAPVRTRMTRIIGKSDFMRSSVSLNRRFVN